MELRPFRSLRYSPAVISRSGLSGLLAPPSERISPDLRQRLYAAAPENIARIIAAEAGAGDTLKSWLADGTLLKERRPGLWIYRQSRQERAETAVVNLLVGLVRLQEPGPDLVLPEEPVPADLRSRRLGFLGETHADFEPCLLATRAPLSGALSTTRRPDLSTALEGLRHDVFRINDFAQHVELQGLVKNAGAELASGLDHYEAARQFARAPAAAKLPGARYKLCAISDEKALKEAGGPPVLYAGLFGVSLEDPVY